MVHPRCATRGDVWDGIELEGIPEDTEDIAPFKVVGDNLIVHRLHPEHPLRLQKETIIHDDHARCEACVHGVGLDPIYSCDECRYILHESQPKKTWRRRFTQGTIGEPVTQSTEEDVEKKIHARHNRGTGDTVNRRSRGEEDSRKAQYGNGDTVNRRRRGGDLRKRTVTQIAGDVKKSHVITSMRR
ncbi:unnamed protein product [Microthlaspi erraticum]|uniref:DC1 domain-containing protein n=1 Tax=Microthlaspi erraticum TaxID=1685480 RepID=A0A6D2KKT7_9BRAS|nr:unnamed protein product [Microthlaspi erraticum]